MYLYAIVILSLSGLKAINSRDLQPENDVSYKRVPGKLSHANTTVVQGNRELSQQPDRCGAVALKCYKPILSYMDADGDFCGWKYMTTFMTLPNICIDIAGFSLGIWGSNSIKNGYRFIKVCDEIKPFQKCLQNNQVCRRDRAMNFVMSAQNTFCDNLQGILPVITCQNAWNSSVNWNKLMYTDWRIVQACPATHYSQLALNAIKLYLFSYITNPLSWTDGFVESVNAEAAGRLICQKIQQKLCLWMRGEAVCSGYLPVEASQNYYDEALIGLCGYYAYNGGKCNALVNTICPVNVTTGHMIVKLDFADIRHVYNMTYWHSLGYSEVNILLHTDNKGIGHCDAGNLIFKQLGCLHQYMTQIDINYANHSDYLTEYMCSRIRIYNHCFRTYISSSCPEEAGQFQAIGMFLQAQCNILSVANRNVTCPLYAVYSHVMYNEEYWFTLIMNLMRKYITVIKLSQINPEPPGWRDVITYNVDNLITDYKSMIIKGEKISNAAFYREVVISTVCDQKTADVYKDFVTLSTGEQFYQFVNHLIKGAEYIKSLAQ